MKHKLMELRDKLVLRKPAVIKSVYDFLKNVCQLEQTRHRSIHNFLVKIAPTVLAYSFLSHKPSIHEPGDKWASPILAYFFSNSHFNRFLPSSTREVKNV